MKRREELFNNSKRGMALSTLIILILAIVLLLFMIAWYTTGLSTSLTRVWEGFTRLI